MTSVHRAAASGQSDSKIVDAAVQAATTAARAEGVTDPTDLVNIVSQASAAAVADGENIQQILMMISTRSFSFLL
jgi:hypothetical protein